MSDLHWIRIGAALLPALLVFGFVLMLQTANSPNRAFRYLAIFVAMSGIMDVCILVSWTVGELVQARRADDSDNADVTTPPAADSPDKD